MYNWARRDSNPHAGYPTRDFKSLASAIPPLARGVHVLGKPRVRQDVKLIHNGNQFAQLAGTDAPDKRLDRGNVCDVN